MVENGILIAAAAGAVLALLGLVRAERQPAMWAPSSLLRASRTGS